MYLQDAIRSGLPHRLPGGLIHEHCYGDNGGIYTKREILDDRWELIDSRNFDSENSWAMVGDIVSVKDQDGTRYIGWVYMTPPKEGYIIVQLSQSRDNVPMSERIPEKFLKVSKWKMVKKA